MNIYLTGFMGSGKSTTGRKIATLLRWNFVDIDRLIVKQEGKSVSEIFDTLGEEYFRQAERKALRTVSARSRTVVACGGGTPCSAENLDIMQKTGVVLYLRLPVETLVTRLEKSLAERPLLHRSDRSDLKERVKELVDKRAVWYEQADIIADGLSTDLEEMTVKLADLIRSKGAFI